MALLLRIDRVVGGGPAAPGGDVPRRPPKSASAEDRRQAAVREGGSTARQRGYESRTTRLGVVGSVSSRRYGYLKHVVWTPVECVGCLPKTEAEAPSKRLW